MDEVKVEGKDWALLDKMIHRNARIPIDPCDDPKRITLNEEGNGDSYDLKILDAPKDAIVIKVDESFENTELLSSLPDQRRLADFIIVSEQEKIVLFVEMKKKRGLRNLSRKKTVAQLKGGLCVFKYCQSLAEQFHDRDDFLGRGYEQRFVVLVKTAYRPRLTRRKVDILPHDDPGNIMEFYFPSSIEFGEIMNYENDKSRR